MCLTLIMVPADMSAGLKKLCGRPCYFQILSTFLYNFCTTYHNMPLYTIIY